MVEQSLLLTLTGGKDSSSYHRCSLRCLSWEEEVRLKPQLLCGGGIIGAGAPYTMTDHELKAQSKYVLETAQTRSFPAFERKSFCTYIYLPMPFARFSRPGLCFGRFCFVLFSSYTFFYSFFFFLILLSALFPSIQKTFQSTVYRVKYGCLPFTTFSCFHHVLGETHLHQHMISPM